MVMQYEQIVTWLIDNCTLRFGEELMLETPQDFIYLSDPHTYELVHISIADPEMRRRMFGDYQGRKCYEVLQGLDAPCPFCTNSRLTKDESYIWKHRNPLMDSEFLLKDRLVDVDGRTLRMEVVMDVTDPERTWQISKDSLEGLNLLVSCMQPLSDERSPAQALETLIDQAGRFFGAAQGYLFCFDRKLPRITWRIPDAHFLGGLEVSEDTLARWGAALDGGRQIIIKDCSALDAAPDSVRRFFEMHGVRSVCATPIFADGRLLGMLCLRNITAHEKDVSLLNTVAAYISQKLQREALRMEKLRALYYDAQNECLNFEGFRIEAARLLRENAHVRYALWYIDIKRFKYINDVFGFDTGNGLLKTLAQLLRSECAADEIFCRISADKFALLAHCGDEAAMRTRFSRMAGQLSAYAPMAKNHFNAELAAGVYSIGRADGSPRLDQMLTRANMAQKNVKSMPGSTLGFYSEVLRKNVMREIRLESEIRPALERGEFVLYLQAQAPISTRALESARMRAEVLVRWERNGRIYAVPGEFIDLFERTGSIIALDRYMFEASCRLIRDLKARGRAPVCLAVNVSRLTLLRPGFVAFYRSIKEKYGIADGEVELEFTENIAVEDFNAFEDVLRELKGAGFICSMDDFGTGQSSLNALQSLPLDILKLDRRFFSGGGTQGRRQTVITNVLRMARELDMYTVAEGVESQSQAEALQTLGFDYIQGYVFSRPIPAAEYEAEFLTREN